MENYIPRAQPTQSETPAHLPSERAADILLQQMQLLLNQSKLACEPDNALNLGPNEKSRILCAMAEAITAGARTVTELEKARSTKTLWDGVAGQLMEQLKGALGG
jgi:hypothetical protein